MLSQSDAPTGAGVLIPTTPGAALERALRRALAEAELLNAIAAAAASEEALDGILGKALSHLNRLITFTGGSIALVEDDCLIVRAAAGVFADTALGQRLPRGTGRSWQVIDSAVPFWSNDLVAEGARPLSPVRSYLAVPLLWRGDAFGLLEVDSTEPDAFVEEDVRLLQRAASAIGGPIQLSRRHAAEQRARAQAEEAVRARDVFLSVAAHELKTPVTSMRGYAQLVLRTLDRSGSIEPGRLRHAVSTIDQQAEKLGRLMTQLLDVTRVDAGRFTLEPQLVDVDRLVRQAIEGLRTHMAQHVVQIITLPDSDGAASRGAFSATVDPLRVEQVLVNLLDNAVKFSPPGSTIDVEIDGQAEDEVRFAVRDRGSGVPQERRSHLFERFFQAHGEGYRGGMGLGLYLSKHIVESHGGGLHVEFPDDGGTRISGVLPRLPSQPT